MGTVIAEYHHELYERVNTLRDITVVATRHQLSIHRIAESALGEYECLAAGFPGCSEDDDRQPGKADTPFSPGVAESSGSSAADFSRII